MQSQTFPQNTPKNTTLMDKKVGFNAKTKQKNINEETKWVSFQEKD